ncbi:MAG: DUF3108 domain-containing protein, partial [Saprospiraceae bacterium]
NAFPRVAPPVNPPAFADACAMENDAFQVGEEVTYKLYYNLNFIWIPAGEAIFKVAEKDNQYHLSVVGKTYKSYEWFFKVRDYYDTYVDKESLLPTLSLRDVREGGYTVYDRVQFDQLNRQAIAERGRSKETIKEYHEIELDDCMHDILSIVYFTRNLEYVELEQAKAIPIKVFMDKETHPLQMRYLGAEADKKIKGLGSFNTQVVSPQVIVGDVFKADDQVKIWVSDDGNRLPLLIESPLSVGSVKAVLKDYKNLRHDLSAKIE